MSEIVPAADDAGAQAPLDVVGVALSAGTLHCVQGSDAQPRIVFRAAVEDLGLEYTGQLQRLRRSSWATVGMTPTVGRDGRTRAMVTVSVRTFLMFMAGVAETRVRKEKQPALRAFQSEAADALEHHFSPETAKPAAPAVPDVPQPRLPASYAEALRELASTVEERDAAVEERDVAREQVQVMTPAADAWTTLYDAHGDHDVADAAKILSRDPAVKIGRDRLFTVLRELRWCYRASDGRHRIYQTALETGRLSERPSSHYHPRTGELIWDPPQVRVTVKGLEALLSHLNGAQPLAIETSPSSQLRLDGAR